MGGVMVLAEARSAGLVVQSHGDKLVVEGPSGAARVVRELFAHKSEILVALRRERAITDPRPDLAEDSALWAALLDLAYDIDGDDPAGLCGALNGMRCYGAALVESAGGTRLLAGEMTTAEYDQMRGEYLLPHRKTLSMQLKRLSAEAA